MWPHAILHNKLKQVNLRVFLSRTGTSWGFFYQEKIMLTVKTTNSKFVSSVVFLLTAFATLLTHANPAYCFEEGISLLFSPRTVFTDSWGSYLLLITLPPWPKAEFCSRVSCHSPFPCIFAKLQALWCRILSVKWLHSPSPIVSRTNRSQASAVMLKQ